MVGCERILRNHFFGMLYERQLSFFSDPFAAAKESDPADSNASLI